ncbi:hypothetical protein TNCV_4559251 [Trichonephila clavipes]|nr:hypothetical protein TNCV_4559251 [Trichonephila clavipes]
MFSDIIKTRRDLPQLMNSTVWMPKIISIDVDRRFENDFYHAFVRSGGTKNLWTTACSPDVKGQQLCPKWEIVLFQEFQIHTGIDGVWNNSAFD